jgi:hypothetical protein
VCNADQGSVGDSAEGVTGGADFFIDLETSAETVMCQLRIVGSEEEFLRLGVECLHILLVNPWVCGCVEAAQKSVIK